MMTDQSTCTSVNFALDENPGVRNIEAHRALPEIPNSNNQQHQLTVQDWYILVSTWSQLH
jgi:hypothetical protein